MKWILLIMMAWGPGYTEGRVDAVDGFGSFESCAKASAAAFKEMQPIYGGNLRLLCVKQ